MDIWMIWTHEKNDEDVIWLAHAMDEDTIEVNSDAWDEALAKTRNDYGAENVRVIKAPLSYAAVKEAFAVPVVSFGDVEPTPAAPSDADRLDGEFLPGDRVAYVDADGRRAAGTVYAANDYLSDMYWVTPFVNGPQTARVSVHGSGMTFLGDPA